MDWDTYEHEDARDKKRRSAAAQFPPDPLSTHRPVVLAGLYPRVIMRPLREDHDMITAESLAARISLDLATVRRVLSHLAEEGFVRGPVELPKYEEDGSPIQYLVYHGLSVYSNRVEWDGRRWVTSIDSFGHWRTVRRKDGSVWRNPPKRLVQRALRKAERARKPADFDGKGYEVLRDGEPYRQYGEAHGFFTEREPEKLRPEPVEMCRRCGTPVGYRTKHGKRRRDHGLRKCNAALVRRIMEE